MKFCPQCGSAWIEGARFCTSCGYDSQSAPVAAAPPPPAYSPDMTVLRPIASEPPPVPPAPVSPAPQTPRAPVLPPASQTPAAPAFDGAAALAKVLTGNWIGMFTVAAATLGTAVLGGLVTALVTATDRSEVGSMIGVGFGFGFDALGAPLVQKYDDDGETYRITSFSPGLTITIAALLVGVLVFRKVTARYPNRTTALADAARAALVMAGLATTLVIILVITNPTVDAFVGRGSGFNATGTPIGYEGTNMGPQVAGAIFLPGFILFAVLALAALAQKRVEESGVLQKIHDRLAPALTALTALVLAAIPAGLVFVLAQATSDNAESDLFTWYSRFLYLPSLGIATLGLGVGAPFGARYGGSGSDGSEDSVSRLSAVAEATNATMWLAIPVALGAVVLAAYMVARRSERTTALWNGVVYLATLLVALPVLTLFSRTSVKFRDDDETVNYRFGIDGTPTTFIIIGISVAALLLLLIATGKLNVTHLQSQPGQQPDQQPGQQPEGQAGYPPPQQYPPQGRPPG